MHDAPRRVYLDHHATTPVDPRVLTEMLPYFTECFGNASSKGHVYGWEAASAVTVARERVAALVGASGPREVVFTSGATESNNLAIKGFAAALGGRRGHIVTTAVEHSAVFDPCRRLQREGFRLTVVPVRPDGIVDPDTIAQAMAPDTVLVSVMLVNNEIGTIQPVEAIGAITRERGVTLHCDAAQGLGRVPIDVDRMNVDLLSLSAHKIYGPKGSGALFVRSRPPKAHLLPLFDGGRQERSMRSGTLDVPSIVGLGRACEIAGCEGVEENARIAGLQSTLLERLRSGIPGVILNGSALLRVSANLNVSFEGIVGARLVAALHDVAVSNGAACASGQVESSKALAALGLSEARIKGAVRFGLGRFNTLEEIEFAAARVIEEVQRMRSEREPSPLVSIK